MALSFPIDLLAEWPGWTTEFDLFYRDEFSRQQNGVTISKELGSPLWRLSATTKMLKPNQLDDVRALLSSLDNGRKTFKGYPLSRVYPQRHPKGAGLPSVSLGSTTVKSIALSGASGLTLRRGDFISVGDYLFQVMEHSSNGAAFEIRPYVSLGVTLAGTVRLERPFCPMMIIPGSVNSQSDVETGRGTVSFQAMETRLPVED